MTRSWWVGGLALVVMAMAGCAAKSHPEAQRAMDKLLAERELDHSSPKFVSHYTIRPKSSACPGCGEPAPDGVEIEDFCCPNPSADDFVAAIPRLGEGTRIIRSGGDVGPGGDLSFKYFEFTPDIREKHLAIVRTASCRCSCDSLDCSYNEDPASFDTDPMDHFQLGSGVKESDALEIVRLFRAGLIEPREWWGPDWSPITNVQLSSVESDGQNFVLRLATEACGFDLVVRAEGQGGKRVLKLLRPMDGGCT